MTVELYFVLIFRVFSAIQSTSLIQLIHFFCRRFVIALQRKKRRQHTMRDSLACLNLNIYHDSAYIWWINWYFVCPTCKLAWDVRLVKATIQQPTGRWLRCDVVTRMWEIFFGSESKPSPLIIIPVLDLRPQKLRYTVLDAWFERLFLHLWK